MDLSSLDVSYFTSLSYYILLLFASRGPFSLVFREDTVDESEVYRRQMNPMGQAAGREEEGAGAGWTGGQGRANSRQATRTGVRESEVLHS